MSILFKQTTQHEVEQAVTELNRLFYKLRVNVRYSCGWVDDTYTVFYQRGGSNIQHRSYFPIPATALNFVSGLINATIADNYEALA